MAFTRDNTGQTTSFTRSGATTFQSTPNFQIFSVTDNVSSFSLNNKWTIHTEASVSPKLTFKYNNSTMLELTENGISDLITCLSNDFGYENWVSKAIEYYADSGDTIILISSSGTSQNIINGAKQAKKMSLPIITFSGFDKNNELRKLSNLSFWVDSNEYNIVEMAHHVWLVSIQKD